MTPSVLQVKKLGAKMIVADNNAWDEAPFSVQFAGFNEMYNVSVARPIDFFAGLHQQNIGARATFTETEHMACTSQDSFGRLACEDRTVKFHLCATLRDDANLYNEPYDAVRASLPAGSGYVGPAAETYTNGVAGTALYPWAGWQAKNMKFFVQLDDNTEDAHRMPLCNDGTDLTCKPKFRLSCPTSDELSEYTDLLKSAQGHQTFNIGCKSMSVLNLPAVGTQPKQSVECDTLSQDKINDMKAATVLVDTTDSSGASTQVSYNKWEYFCGSHVDRRLMFSFENTQSKGKDAMKCPFDFVNDNTWAGMSTAQRQAAYNKLPYVLFTVLDDDDEINISKRPTLKLVNDALPDAGTGANTRTCGSFSSAGINVNTNAVKLRINDDETFMVDNSYINRDVSTHVTDFSTVQWDGTEGKLKWSVHNKMYVAPEEKTFVNVALGGCEQENAATGAPSLEDHWNRYQHHYGVNAFYGSQLSNMTEDRIFGNCDLYDLDSLQALGIGPQTSNIDLFKALFGDDSCQPTAQDYANLAAHDMLRGFNENNVSTASCKNTLYPPVRNLGATGKWTVDAHTMTGDWVNHGEIGSQGFSAHISLTLEKLKQCMTRKGESVVVTTMEPETAQTKYTFKVSTTTATAKRKADLDYDSFSVTCTEQTYNLRIGTKLYALSGMNTDTTDNVYIDSAKYASSDHNNALCYNPQATAPTPKINCVDSPSGKAGPGHKCITDGDLATEGAENANLVKALEFEVYADMQVIANTNAGFGTTRKSYYGVHDINEVLATSANGKAENCYGVEAYAVEHATANAVVDAAQGNHGGAIEKGLVAQQDQITRTIIKFRSNCLYTRPYDATTQTWQTAIQDTFAKCADTALDPTNFNFEMRLWECKDVTHLKNPVNSPLCQLMPDFKKISLSLAFVENPVDVDYTVDYSKLLRMYVSGGMRHDNAISGPAVATYNNFDTWRKSVTASVDTAKYTTNGMLVVSFGLQDGSALEATMISAIDNVRMCNIKKQCYMDFDPSQNPWFGAEPYVKDTVNQEKCTFKNVISDATHSPMALWATNKANCVESSTNKCKALTRKTMGSTPPTSRPHLTCDKVQWEDFALAEAEQYTTGEMGTIATVLASGGIAITKRSLATMLNPVLESMLVIEGSKTTAYASSIHGNCEIDPETVTDNFPLKQTADRSSGLTSETVVKHADDGTDVYLQHYFPKSAVSSDKGAGACTCKGMLSYNYVDSTNNRPFQGRTQRKVVYTGDNDYSYKRQDLANLHLCSYYNTPRHSTNNLPLTSVDVFMISLKRFQVDTEYVFEFAAVQYDKDAITQYDETNSAYNQFSARRLLAATNDLDILTKAKLSKQIEAHGAPKRKLLNVLTHVDPQLTSSALMPQGMVAAMPLETDEREPHPHAVVSNDMVTVTVSDPTGTVFKDYDDFFEDDLIGDDCKGKWGVALDRCYFRSHWAFGGDEQAGKILFLLVTILTLLWFSAICLATCKPNIMCTVRGSKCDSTNCCLQFMQCSVTVLSMLMHLNVSRWMELCSGSISDAQSTVYMFVEFVIFNVGVYMFSPIWFACHALMLVLNIAVWTHAAARHLFPPAAKYQSLDKASQNKGLTV